MELSWRTGLILVGLIGVVVIIIDGVRRMRRARSEALKLDISNEFKFPEGDHNPELPGGGFRVVSPGGSEQPLGAKDYSVDASAEFHSEESRAETRFRGMSAARRVSDERLEPVLGDMPVIQDDEPGLLERASEPLSSNSPHSGSTTAVVAPAERDLTASGQGHGRQPLDIADDSFEDTISTWLDEREGEGDIKLSESVADNAARMVDGQASIIPTAKPINLDEEVPILMSVEDLGDREVKIEEPSAEETPVTSAAKSKSAESDGQPKEQAVAEEIERAIEPSTKRRVQDPHLEREFSDSIASEKEQVTDFGYGQPAEETPPTDRRSPVVFANPDADQLANRVKPEVVLSIHAFCRGSEGFSGEALLHLFDACDLRYGREGIFHRFEEADGRGPIQFSVSQTFEPGIFNPDTIKQESFSSLSFFMSLPGPSRPLEAYLAMSEMARVMETQLGAELLDSSRSVFTRQTVEHDRQQIVDYERRRQLAEKKQSSRKKRRR